MGAASSLDAAPAMEVVATAGHVDHGKSALLHRLTGMEPDRWDEERRRGLTIDLGYVWTDVTTADGTSRTVAFVDVPGHDGFLSNMLAGVGVVEQVLLVVAADDGWSAQSQEHLEILDLLGRRAVAAVVTKADLVGEARTREVVLDVERRLADTSLAGAPVLAVDSLTGTGIDRLRAVLAERLMTPSPHDTRPGATEAPGTGAPVPRAPAPIVAPAGSGGCRLWIDRSFTVTGAGTVVTGLLVAGGLTIGDEVVVAPPGRRGRVRGLQCLGRSVGSVDAGSRVAVNLSGVDHGQVDRGDVLLAAHDLGTSGRPGGGASRSVDVRLQALPHAPIGRKGAWHLHVGTATSTVTIHPLLGDIEPGSHGHARLELDHPLPLRIGDRFVLREAGRRRTVGGGVVLDPAPGERPRGADRRLDHALVLDALADAGDVSELVVALVDAHHGRRPLQDLAGLLGDQDALKAAIRDAGAVTTIEDQVVRRDHLAPWRSAIMAAAEAAPAEHAVERAALVAAAAERGCPRELAPGVLDQAVQDGELTSYGGWLVHARHEPAYLAARASRRSTLLAVLEEEPLHPPNTSEATGRADLPTFELRGLLDEGYVVACGPLLFSASAIADAVTRLREGPGADGRPFTAAEARDTWETTRRAAMPLLEHLQATGVTSFDGERHRLTGPAPGS